jgi:transcriptional regulator with XRE-family HTH domain
MASVAAKTLAERIRECRVALGIDQAELARRAGVHKAQVMRWEQGTYHPLLESVIRLARALEVSVDYLVDGGPAGPDPDDRDRCMVVIHGLRCSLPRDHPPTGHEFSPLATAV